MAAGRKTGGRQKGTTNKNKAELRALLAEKFPDYHPVAAMAAIANDSKVKLEHRITCHREVAKYVEPQLKAVEHSVGDENKGLHFTMNLTRERKRSRTNGAESPGVGSGNGRSRPRPSTGQ